LTAAAATADRSRDEAAPPAGGEGTTANASAEGRTANARGDALDALVLLARLHQVAADAGALRHDLGVGPSEVIRPNDVLRSAQALGLSARLVRVSPERLATTPLPALAPMRDGSTALVARVDGQRVLLQASGGSMPLESRPSIEPLEHFVTRWTGELILVASRASLRGELARFDFSWFVPGLVKYRGLLGETIAVSILLQLLALVTPLFFQVVMDKVLVHRGFATLDVLVFGLVVVVLFESTLSALRGYVLGHTAQRLDVELGSRLYRHLLALPLAWFEARRVGDSVARVRELESIRQFLTGQAPTLLLDLLFSIVFLAIMFLYSVPLTLIVLASVPLYVLITLVVVPVLRTRLDEKFARGAETQAMLVETISGVQTVKSAALEPQMSRRWDQSLAGYVSASFRAGVTGMLGHEAIALVGKLVTAATLWYGAHLVMQEAMTVGMFVAFNMFAARVAQPILRLAQMASDFQQVGIAMRRLADILDTPTETASASASSLPTLQGDIRFDDVRFRYRPDSPPVIDGLSLHIRPGEVVGIVGRSGSGKSTLARLVQRMHVPEQGRVLIDGVDAALIDAASLRRQVGVVLQDNLLFNRSVRENIAIGDPAAPLERVIRAATLAGAHDFVCELPRGYDTLVGEHGTGLSGGQRQRLAIARTLFGDPRILVFDEATSALDYESEAVLQRHMTAICRGRTVIVIAHRLATVRRADRILVLERGRLVEAGSHDDLMKRPGLYARLWQLQSGELR
jgi:subfamily B ATP-binding cassette protein HlyB/CyaB